MDSDNIEKIYSDIVNSQELEKEMYDELEKYKTSKEKTDEIVRELNLHVIRRRKLISKLRTFCIENCEENCENYTESFTNQRRIRRRRIREREREIELKNKLICSKFEKIIEEEEVLNFKKNSLKDKLKLTLPLESITIKAVKLNSNNEKKYTALTNIMYNLFFMFIVLNIVVIIEIFFPNIPKFPLNLIKIIAIGIGCTLVYISYQDHYTRDDYDYDKYKFSNDKAVYTNVSGTTSGTTSSINNDIESGTKVNGCVLDLCENGNCCPDEMFFDRVKGMCVVGTENTISNE